MSTVIQFLIVIGAILLGTRFGGMGIGIISCLGLGILTLFLELLPERFQQMFVLLFCAFARVLLLLNSAEA